MRTSSPSRTNASERSSRQGVMLVECMVYVAVVTVVVGLSVVLFSKMLSLNEDLKRNSEDIVRCLRAGERWRVDIRQATGPLKVFDEGPARVLTIPTETGDIVYRYHLNRLWRDSGDSLSPQPILNKLKSCEFVADPRDSVQAWRWDLELIPKKRIVGLEPRFSFLAVPQRIPSIQP